MVGAWGVGGLAGPMAPLLAVPPASKHRGQRCYGVVGACMVAMVTSKEMLPFALPSTFKATAPKLILSMSLNVAKS